MFDGVLKVADILRHLLRISFCNNGLSDRSVGRFGKNR
ncbi:hypothetical protein EVA_05769 [gut metagenome]|uniref:Uncharacterized protein n=1 Tax=gut metagenome TaxID=749906 RepID=J9GZ19_9ZZZZ